jgi:hypothetical protein
VVYAVAVTVKLWRRIPVLQFKQGERWASPLESPAIMNQTLETMGCYIQGGGIHGVLVAARRPGALRFENIVDFILDIRELGFGLDLPYSPRQGIKRIQRTFQRLGIRK